MLQNLKTISNNSDVDRYSEKSRQSLRVPVINMRGKPLMPTTPRKAKKLLKAGKAKVVQRAPFTIQLLYPTGEQKQDITLGIDAGYSFIGFSAVTDNKELIAGELELRKNVSDLIQDKKMYRRLKRNKLWYRKPRFLNRKIEKGWIAPSMEHKLQSHIRLVDKIKKLLPITKVIVEVASFDTQQMQKPEITGKEYQQGELQGYEIREYLLEKYGRKCAYCGKKNVSLEIEHIIPKSRGGTNSVSNLTIACHECNQKKGNKTATEFGYPDIQKQAKQSLKGSAFMNIVRWKLVNLLNCNWTFGYITKYLRIKFGIEKSHSNDAFVIAGGTIQERTVSYKVTQTRRNNRKLQLNRKGFKPSIRRQRYKLQSNDLVKMGGNLYRINGVHGYGKYAKLMNKIGEIINVNVKKLVMIKYGKGMQWNF